MDTATKATSILQRAKSLGVLDIRFSATQGDGLKGYEEVLDLVESQKDYIASALW